MRTIDTAKHEERRAQILAAAQRCFARSGFHGGTISQICVEARISPGHLYHYFKSKEAIIAAIAESGLDYAQSRMTELAAAKTDAISAVVTELANLRNVPRGTGHGILLDVLAEASRDPGVGKSLQEASEAKLLLLASFFEDAQARGEIDPTLDSQMIAAIVISLIDAGKALSIRCPDLDMTRLGASMEDMLRRFLTPQS